MINWKNILERAAWTFIEAFLVALPDTIRFDLDGAAWKSALMSAACAGMSAVKTLILEIVQERKQPPDSEPEE